MRGFLHIFSLCLALISLSSCRRDYIYDLVSRYRIEFEYPDGIRYDNPGKPSKISVIFYDINTGKKVYETYSDGDGCYLYAITPGCYNVVAYALGTRKTDVTYVNDFNLLTAETSVISQGAVKTVASPDHLLADVKRNCEIPVLSDGDPDFVLKFSMESLCDDWKIVVEGIKNLEYASSINFFIDSQWREFYFGLDERKDGCVLNVRGGQDNIVEDRLVATFETFGVIPETDVRLEVRIVASDGQKHVLVVDVTDQIYDPDNIDHILKVFFDTELKPLTQGGLDPSTDEWDENRTTIDIS